MSQRQASYGGKRSNAGRKPGVSNKVLPEIKQIILDGIKPYLQDIPKLLEGLEPKEKVEAILELIPYVCSKFAPTPVDEPSNTQSNEQQFTISVKPVDYRSSAAPLEAGSDEDYEASRQN